MRGSVGLARRLAASCRLAALEAQALGSAGPGLDGSGGHAQSAGAAACQRVATRWVTHAGYPDDPVFEPIHIQDEAFCRQRQLVPLGFREPILAPDTWIAPNAVCIGDCDLFDQVRADAKLQLQSWLFSLHACVRPGSSHLCPTCVTYPRCCLVFPGQYLVWVRAAGRPEYHHGRRVYKYSGQDSHTRCQVRCAQVPLCKVSSIAQQLRAHRRLRGRKHRCSRAQRPTYQHNFTLTTHNSAIPKMLNTSCCLRIT